MKKVLSALSFIHCFNIFSAAAVCLPVPITAILGKLPSYISTLIVQKSNFSYRLRSQGLALSVPGLRKDLGKKAFICALLPSRGTGPFPFPDHQTERFVTSFSVWDQQTLHPFTSSGLTHWWKPFGAIVQH